jgi:Protein of unknown function (DUF2934)
MPSGKSINKSPQSPEQNLVVSEKPAPVEAPKPRSRTVKAASSDSKLISKSAPKIPVKSTTTTSDKAAPKTTRHRPTVRAGVKPVAAATVVSAVEITALAEETPAILAMAAAVGASHGISAPAREITQREIAALAYSYYVARDYQTGNQYEDWLRAERELISRQ